MRSRMLGLAIALSTFGLGVAATTVWIAYDTPANSSMTGRPRAELVATPDTTIRINKLANCAAVERGSAGRLLPPVVGGVLNDKAISKSAPIYSSQALAAGASGPVVVSVLVNECGNVQDARAISGHPLLRVAAVDASLQWQFPPMLRSGQPVKVSGTITFNFVLQ